MTSADLFALLSISWRLPEVCGTFESRLRSNFTSRDLRGRELLAAWPVFPRCLWVVLWGIFVPFWQMASDFVLLQLILTGGAGDSWSGWAGLWVGQEQGFGYCTPHNGQWPYRTSGTSGSDPALRLSSDVCLEVLLLSLLVSLLSLLFLPCPVFVFTLGLSVKHGSLSRVATTSSHFTPRAASVQPAFAGFEEYVVHESFLLQLFKSAEGDVWLLCRLQLSWGLPLYFWGFPRPSVNPFCWEERWGLDSLVGSTNSKLECLELWVGGGCLWAGLSEACALLWPSVQEFCWLDLIQFPNCQSTWFAPGASGYKKTQTLGLKNEEQEIVQRMHVNVQHIYLSFHWVAHWVLWRLLSGAFTVWLWSWATLWVTGAGGLYASGMCCFKWTTAHTHTHTHYYETVVFQL